MHLYKTSGRRVGVSPMIGWDTRIRTRKNRTKTCCVTITPYPNPEAFIAKSAAKVGKNYDILLFIIIFFTFTPLFLCN